MKIALIGATGHIGRHIAAEALRRGHEVTALLRPGSALPAGLDGASGTAVSLGDADALAAAVRGHDAIASAFGPRGEARELATVTQALLEAARQGGVSRLVVVGGAGSLEVAPGVQLVDTPGFPEAYKPHALAHREALGVLKAADDIRRTFYAPAAEIGPGERRGGFQAGGRGLLTGADGHSRISYADYAEAFVDELEHPARVRDVATVAYR